MPDGSRVNSSSEAAFRTMPATGIHRARAQPVKTRSLPTIDSTATREAIAIVTMAVHSTAGAALIGTITAGNMTEDMVTARRDTTVTADTAIALVSIILTDMCRTTRRS